MHPGTNPGPLAVAVVLALFLPASAPARARPGQAGWIDTFDVDRADLASTGRNPYVVLEPGYVLTLADGGEQLIITVLDETRRVGGVETRVVEERETDDGRLVEVSRNFFAISRRTADVFYFGEEVDIYKGGKVAGHEGAWLAGENGARFGLMMPGSPRVGLRHYQEIAPRVAMDRAEIVSLDETITTPAGRFTNVLKVLETTPLEPLAREHKFYAKDIGLIQDGSLKLTKRLRARGFGR